MPVVIFFFNRIPGAYSDTFQVWGKTLEFQNFISDNGIFSVIWHQIENIRFGPIETIAWLQLITNDFVGYNIVWLASFVLAAVGMYALTFYLTKNKFAAIVSGVIFSFSPFHISQAISTNIGTMHYEWIPFFLLFYIKFLRHFKIKDFLLTGVFLILVTFSEHQLVAFLFPFVAIFTLAFLIKNSEKIVNWKFWAYSLSGFIVFFLLIKLMFGSLFEISQSENNYLDAGKDQVLRYSAEAVEPFTPQAFHPIWGEKFNRFRENSQSNSMGRKSTYIGYSVILLSIVSLFGFKRRFWIKFFFFSAGIFFTIMSFGPYLIWMGEINRDSNLPWGFLYDNLKYWDNIRTVSRVYVISLLCFSISAGFGVQFLIRQINKHFLKDKLLKEKIAKIKELKKEKREKKKLEKEKAKIHSLKDYKEFILKRFNIRKKEFLDQFKIIKKEFFNKKKINFKQRKKYIFTYMKERIPFFIALFSVAIITIEYISIPIPTMSMNYSKFYDIIREEKEHFSILEIPGSTSYDYASKLMIYDQIHRKNNLSGTDLARVVKDKWNFQKNTPVISELLYTLPDGGEPPSKEIINDYYFNLGTKILNHYNIRYIVVSKEAMDLTKGFKEEYYNNTIDFINEELDVTAFYEDNFLKAYKVNQSEHLNGWFLAMDLTDDYWGQKQGSGQSVARWAKNGAKLRLVNLGDTEMNIRLLFKTKIKYLRNLNIYLNEELQEDTHIKEEKEEHVIDLTGVKPGENIIRFEILNPDGKPVNEYILDRGLKFSDVRTMSERVK